MFRTIYERTRRQYWLVLNMRINKYGYYLVNIVTINRMGMAGMAHSGAARAGVKNLSQSLGAEWMEYGIKINNIAPGTVYSPTAQVNYNLNLIFKIFTRMLSIISRQIMVHLVNTSSREQLKQFLLVG